VITERTDSERIFEQFLRDNGIAFERVIETDSPRPDYAVTASGAKLLFEIKELDEDENFSLEPLVGISRTMGDHIRRKIAAARRQVKFGAAQGIPSILLVYNNIDPLHLFGTEDMDFITAMYGEYTVLLDKRSSQVMDAYNGRNQSLAEAKNRSFSAIGRLWPVRGNMSVMLFDNVFSKVKIPYEKLPPCFEVTRIEVTH
jgi:hypothetical protein